MHLLAYFAYLIVHFAAQLLVCLGATLPKSEVK
jgi:hypothetical protein